MEMGEQQYGGLPDLRQLLAAGRTTHIFQAALPGGGGLGESYPGCFHGAARNLQAGAPHGHYEMMTMMNNHNMGGAGAASSDDLPPRSVALMDFRSESSSHSAALDESGLWDGGGNGRWPRQETLTLLEIRSRLDPRFKEANQKGPLWDEVARLMAEEHGYHRSGKKCREKFENLYKYYKKTKEGKAGRQDGKHYRFFRQLEALYGENNISSNQTLETNNHVMISSTNNNQSARVGSHPGCSNPANGQEAFPASQKLSESLSLSNSSEFDSSSSEDAEKNSCTPAGTENDSSFGNIKKLDPKNLKRGRRKSWKSKIREFVDLQMKKFMEIQETWLEKMLTTLEKKEQERMSREEEWRKQEAERFEREQKFWAKERAWVQSRDMALMEALQKISGKEVKVPSPEELTAMDHLHEEEDNNDIEDDEVSAGSARNILSKAGWAEADQEVLSLMRVRSSMEPRFQRGGCSQNASWEEISGKMSCLGYDNQISANRYCKEKCEKMNTKYHHDHLVRKNKDYCSNNYKKRKNSKTRPTHELQQHLDQSVYIPGGGTSGAAHESDDQQGPNERDVPSPSNSIPGPAVLVNDLCLNFLMGNDQGDNLWENYVMKINKGEQSL